MFGIKNKKKNSVAGISGRDLVGVNFGPSNMKIVHLRSSSGRVEVMRMISRDIAGLADGDISKVLAASFGKLGVKNPYIISAVTSNLAITKNIEIPSTDHKEIREIVNLQAGRHTPYSREEIVIDCIDIGTYKNAYTKILLIIIGRNVIRRQFDIAAHAGLKLDKVLFVPEGLAASCGRILNVNTLSSPVGLVNIDEAFSDFTIVYKNRPVFVRSIPMGAQHFAADREVCQARFADELKRSLEMYQGENIEKSPEAVILTGVAEEASMLEPVLRNNSSVPVKVAPYLGNLIIKDKAEETMSGVRHMSFLDLISLLAALDELKITLIPEEVKISRSIEERGRELVKTGIFVSTLFVLICLTLITNIYFKSSYLKKLTSKYETLNREARQLEESFELASFAKNYIANRGYSLETLSELTGLAPVNLELNEIRFDEQGKLSLRGTAESMSTVFAFVEALDKSKYFKDVKTKYTSKRKEGAKDLTDFEITAALNKKGD